MKKRFSVLFLIIAVTISLSAFSIVSCSPSSTADTQMAEETVAAETVAEEEMMEAETMVEEEMAEDEEMVEEEEMSGYMDVTPEEAKKLIDENPDLIIIDVSPKYDEGHLPGAINYYAGDGSLDEAIPTLDPEAEYLVYCHVDSVSIAGAQALVDAGFENVYRLAGNYAAWVDAGYPVEK
jgi:adenylyltransferase/sulfurtransferase